MVRTDSEVDKGAVDGGAAALEQEENLVLLVFVVVEDTLLR